MTMTSSYSYVGDVNPNLICCVCQAPFLVPTVTTTCFHTFCRDCIVRSLETQRCCPVDRSPLTIEDLKPETLLLKNMVDELIVECSQKPMGCKHTCQRQLLDSHMKEFCQFIQVPCSEEGCKQMVSRKDLGRHLHSCMHRSVLCETCGISMRASDFEAHDSDCLQQDMTCSACSRSIKRSNLLRHTSVCEAVEVNCEYSSQGCAWVGARKSLSMHLQKCPYEAIKGFFSVNESKMAALRDENFKFRQKLDNAEAIIHTLQRENDIARNALGPWWKPDNQGSSSRVPDSNTGLTHNMQSMSSLPSVESPRPWSMDAPSPLETTPFFSSSEIDSIDRTIDPLSDPAFVASFFPNGPIDARAMEYANSTNSQGLPAAAQWDPVTRHIFPLYSRNALFPPSRLRYPELSPGFGSPGMQQYQRHSEATAQQQQQRTQLPAQQGQASVSARVAPINRSSSLEDALSGLRGSVVALQAGQDSLSRRTDVALAAENLRMNEEVGALRAVLHGMRMQMHALVTERNGHGWGPAPIPPPPPTPPAVGTMPSAGAGAAASVSPGPQQPHTTKL